MKNILLLLISLLISFNLYSQNEFIYKCDTSDYNTFTDLLIKNDSTFYILGAQTHNDSTLPISRDNLIEMNMEGSVIKSISLTTDSENIFLTKIKRVGNEIFIFGSSQFYNEYCIIKYDTNLNEISHKKLFKDTTITSRTIYDVLIIDTNIFITSFDFYGSPFFLTFSILKINTNLDSLANYVAKPYSGLAYSAIDDKNGGIKVFTTYYKIGGYGQIAHFDKNLTELSVSPLPDLLHLTNNSIWLTDTTFLVTGTTEYIRDSIYVPYYYDWDMGIIVLDTNNNELDYSIQIRRNSEEETGWYQNIDKSKTNGYYFVGTQNLGNRNSKIILTKLDSAFNIIWEKTIGDDTTGYTSMGIYTLPDSSVMLLCRNYESATSTYLNAYAYKISQEGAVLSSANIGKQRIGRLNIFPNPAIDYINIATLGGVDKIVSYKIYDIQGKVVMDNKVFSNTVRINTSHFASGNYVVVANTLKGSVVSGKFVVKK